MTYGGLLGGGVVVRGGLLRVRRPRLQRGARDLQQHRLQRRDELEHRRGRRCRDRDAGARGPVQRDARRRRNCRARTTSPPAPPQRRLKMRRLGALRSARARRRSSHRPRRAPHRCSPRGARPCSCPGIGSITGERASSHASASCAGEQPQPLRRGLERPPPAVERADREREERQERDAVLLARREHRLGIVGRLHERPRCRRSG